MEVSHERGEEVEALFVGWWCSSGHKSVVGVLLLGRVACQEGIAVGCRGLQGLEGPASNARSQPWRYAWALPLTMQALRSSRLLFWRQANCAAGSPIRLAFEWAGVRVACKAVENTPEPKVSFGASLTITLACSFSLTLASSPLGTSSHPSTFPLP